MKPPAFFAHWLRDWRIRRDDRRFRRMRRLLESLEQDDYTRAAVETVEQERGRCLETYAKSG